MTSFHWKVGTLISTTNKKVSIKWEFTKKRKWLLWELCPNCSFLLILVNTVSTNNYKNTQFLSLHLILPLMQPQFLYSFQEFVQLYFVIINRVHMIFRCLAYLCLKHLICALIRRRIYMVWSLSCVRHKETLLRE